MEMEMSDIKQRNIKSGQSRKVSFASTEINKWRPPSSVVDNKSISNSAVTINSIIEADAIVRDDRHEPESPHKPVGCFSRFMRSIQGLWRTPIIAGVTEEDREQHVSIMLRELVIYLIFLVVFCVMSFCMLQPTMFYLTKVMQGLFVDDPGFADITTTTGFWDYVSGPLIEGLHKEKYYDGSDVHHTEIGYIFFENKLLGRPRLRQVRVRNDSCRIPKLFEKSITDCYGEYSAENEEVKSYWNYNDSAWEYKSAEQLRGRPVTGRLANYEGGGYVATLSDTAAKSSAVIANLKANDWIDRGTRAVIIDFTVYNGNINMFSLIRLIFEFPATGGCITLFKFQSIKLLRYVTNLDYFVMACEGIIIIYIFYYIVEEMMEISIKKWRHFLEMWTLIDIGLILLTAACIAINLYRTLKVNSQLENILKNRDKYGNFELLGYWQEKFNDLVAITIFVAWFKVFKFLGFNKTMAELQGTMIHSAQDVGAFAIVFIIIFFGYAQWGHLLFGPYLKDFSSFSLANFTLFRIILGDFDFDALYATSRIMGPIYFLTYIFAFTFILMNMFLAIIFDTYADVKEELEENDDGFEIGEYFQKGYDKLASKLKNQRSQIDDIRVALQIADENQVEIDFEDWRRQLKVKGHHDVEIEAVFTKYDTDGDRILNREEQTKMLEDLQEEEEEVVEEMAALDDVKKDSKILLSKIDMRNEEDDSSDESEKQAGSEEVDMDRLIEREEYDQLVKRVKSCEEGLTNIASRIEEVLDTLETMDKLKMESREFMDELIDEVCDYTVEGIPNYKLDWWDDEEVPLDASRQPSTIMQSRASYRVDIGIMNASFMQDDIMMGFDNPGKSDSPDPYETAA